MTKTLNREERTAIEDKAREAALAAVVGISKAQHEAYSVFLAIRDQRTQMYNAVYTTTLAKLRAEAQGVGV
jgi:hypothetical protein